MLLYNRTSTRPSPGGAQYSLRCQAVQCSAGWSPVAFSLWLWPIMRKEESPRKCVGDLPGSGVQGCAVARSGRSQRSASGKLRDAKLRMITHSGGHTAWVVGEAEAYPPVAVPLWLLAGSTTEVTFNRSRRTPGTRIPILELAAQSVDRTWGGASTSTIIQ